MVKTPAPCVGVGSDGGLEGDGVAGGLSTPGFTGLTVVVDGLGVGFFVGVGDVEGLADRLGVGEGDTLGLVADGAAASGTLTGSSAGAEHAADSAQTATAAMKA